MTINTNTDSALDVQVGGGHYKDQAIQPIEFAMANGLDACQASITKYLTRHPNKGLGEDLDKVGHYIQLQQLLGYNGVWNYLRGLVREALQLAHREKDFVITPRDYCAANGMDSEHADILDAVCRATKASDLDAPLISARALRAQMYG